MATERHTPGRASEALLALGHLCHSLHGDGTEVRTGPEHTGPEQWRELSKRQWMILEMLAKGLTDDRIAHNLDLSERTVRAEVSGIREQLAATSRFQLGMRFAETVSPGAGPSWSCPLRRSSPRVVLAPSG